MPDSYYAENQEALAAFARQFIASLTRGCQVGLRGELGVGKTAFVQAVARGLGVQEAVTSPTFSVVTTYAVTNHPVIRTLVHADLYRLTAPVERADVVVQEILAASTPSALVCIEWIERAPALAKTVETQLVFTYGKTPTERVITLV